MWKSLHISDAIGRNAVDALLGAAVDAAHRGSLEKALRERLVATTATSDVTLPHERLDVWLQADSPSVAVPRGDD